MEGQLNAQERAILTDWIHALQPHRVIEVGTWKGGGSTLHILKAMEKNDKGHLWGVEACRGVYDEMITNIRAANESLLTRFTPVFGFSQQAIPEILRAAGCDTQIDMVFLDGGDNPMEQVEEFQLLQNSVPIGGVLLSHDAKLRKGKWLVPYLEACDNWKCTLHDVSTEGLFEARKTADQPSDVSEARAASRLRRLRLEPKELLGRHLPSPVIDAMLRLLPRKFVLSITQGRK